MTTCFQCQGTKPRAAVNVLSQCLMVFDGVRVPWASIITDSMTLFEAGRVRVRLLLHRLEMGHRGSDARRCFCACLKFSMHSHESVAMGTQETTLFPNNTWDHLGYSDWMIFQRNTALFALCWGFDFPECIGLARGLSLWFPWTVVMPQEATIQLYRQTWQSQKLWQHPTVQQIHWTINSLWLGLLPQRKVRKITKAAMSRLDSFAEK